MTKVLFHSFATQGYMPWVELYLESLRYNLGDEVNIRIDTLNFTDEQIELIKNINSKVDLRNRNKDFNEAAKELGVDENDFQNWRYEIESGNVTDINYLFKIYISVNQRYRNLEYVVKEAKAKGYNYLIHSDIDVYFRKNLDGLFNILEEHDFAAYFREGGHSKKKILGAFLAFNLNRNIDKFISEWMNQIDNVPFLQRWRDFGQSALWEATQNCDSNVKIVDLSNNFFAPSYSQTFNKNAHIWLNSNSVAFYSIRTPYLKSWHDFKNGFPRIDTNNKGKKRSILIRLVQETFEYIYIFARKYKRKIQGR